MTQRQARARHGEARVSPSDGQQSHLVDAGTPAPPPPPAPTPVDEVAVTAAGPISMKRFTAFSRFPPAIWWCGARGSGASNGGDAAGRR